MKTLAKKIIEKVIPGDAENAARGQVEELLATLAADKKEAAGLEKDIAGWKRECEAIHEKGYGVTVADGDYVQARLGKIDVADIRLQALGAAIGGTQLQIDTLFGRFPRLRSLVTAA